MYILQQTSATGPSKLGNVVCQMENQTESRKNQGDDILQVRLTRKTEPNLKLYGETLKVYPQVKFLGIIFESQLTFQKHFEDILDPCNTRYHRLKLLFDRKWGPSPSNIIQIYKQCVSRIFEYGSLSTIAASDNIISKIQWLQNKFIQLALHLPKYIYHKLFHDVGGLQYVKDKLLSCATRSLDRIAQNPPVKESTGFQHAQSSMGPFPNAFISSPSCKSLDKCDLLG